MGEKHMKPEPDNHAVLPLTETTFFILLCLSPGPKHGYAIMKEVNQMSDGRIAFSTGTLYGALKRLLDLGWILRSDDETEVEDETGRSRKDYSLSSLGMRILNLEVNRMQSLVRLATSAQSSGV
jgi:DNA-binding PadR family transcriptional regulator